MTKEMAVFFPTEFTAVAQWLICTIHILTTENRLRGWRVSLLILFALPILILLNLAHSEQPALVWLIVTACCLLAVLIYLRLGIKEDGSLILQHWSNAVMQAELAAAIAWLVNGILESHGIVHFPDIRASQTIMLIVYLGVCLVLGVLIYHQAHRKERITRLNPKEVSTNLMIALGAYLLSNVSFMLPNSIMGVSIGAGILYVRVMADLVGVVALVAFDEFCYALRLNVNVQVMQSLLDRQYEQYQQFKVNNEQMQQVYHDIKHLIHYIRSVSSSQKYEKELQNLEETVANYETQYDTGNSVLDVVVGSKKMMCRSENITMECYVDAREIGFMDAVHICTIFGNALDNAIEYECRIPEVEKRLIKVSVFSENQFLMIHIRNYCEEKILTSADDPQTTKQNPEMHGFGIKGIRLAAEQYNGHVSIKQENNWFVVSILIPIPPHGERGAV